MMAEHLYKVLDPNAGEAAAGQVSQVEMQMEIQVEMVEMV
jgi:hypothetical protein